MRNIHLCHLSSTSSSSSSKEPPQLPAAELCCQTGCHNCIYIQFADELVEYCNQIKCDPHLEVRKVTNSTSLLVMLDMLIEDAKRKIAYEQANCTCDSNGST